MTKIILSALVASSIIAIANAEETAIISHAELGYVSTTGNTETETFNFDGSVKKDWEKHAAILKANAAYGKDGEIESKNKFFIEGAYDYKFTDTVAFNYIAAYKQDKFSGFDSQIYTGPGVKYKALKNEQHALDLTASVLYSIDDIEDVEENEEYASYKAEVAYAWQVLENLKFNQDLSYRASFEDNENYFIFSKSALTTKISDIFSAGISYKVDYTNLAPTGKEQRDNTLAMNLILDY